MGYPPANRTAQWFHDAIGGANMGPVEKVVWHTTETSSWPSYDGGRKAPHYTVRPDYGSKTMLWRQHFPDTVNSRAMRNEPGGVQTNLDGALQVEIVGTCDETRSWPARVLRSWDLEDWQVEGLAQFVVWAHREHGVPLKAPALWLAYGRDDRAPGHVPASYGAGPARMTGKTWNAFRGHCGHQHAPENSHGDPGRLPMSRVLARAAVLLEPATDLLEDLMADPQERAALAAEVADAVVNVPRPLMPYVSRLYSDADGKMSIGDLVQHAAGQAHAANTAADEARQQGEANAAAIAALRTELAALKAEQPPAGQQ